MNGPWWFSSAGGRFDLAVPRGTCYLAVDTETAIREASGHALARSGVIMEAWANDRVVSHLTTDPLRVADTVDPLAARCGFIREVCTMTPYDIPQAWAAGFDSIGLAGISYQSRFTTGDDANALALFGAAGEDKASALDLTPTPLAEAARSCGIPVTATPRAATMITPPGTSPTAP